MNRKKKKRSRRGNSTRRHRGTKNRGNRIFLSVVALFYIFFFTSKAWIPEKGTVYYSDMGTKAALGEEEFTLLRWEYSPGQNLMEVEFDKNGPSGGENLQFSCVDQKGRNYRCREAAQTPTMLVLQIEGIRNFENLSLRLSDGESTVKFYTNKDAVDLTDQLTEKSVEGYYIERLSRSIRSYQEEIQCYREEIKILTERIAGNKETVRSLEEAFGYAAADEAESIEMRIKTINGNIELDEAKIKDYEDKIREASAKMAEAAELLTTYRQPSAAATETDAGKEKNGSSRE